LKTALAWLESPTTLVFFKVAEISISLVVQKEFCASNRVIAVGSIPINQLAPPSKEPWTVPSLRIWISLGSVQPLL